MTNQEMDKAIHVFYCNNRDLMCEYQWDAEYSMYRYSVYSKSGTVEKGLIGSERMIERGKDEGWEFIGVI